MTLNREPPDKWLVNLVFLTDGHQMVSSYSNPYLALDLFQPAAWLAPGSPVAVFFHALDPKNQQQ